MCSGRRFSASVRSSRSSKSVLRLYRRAIRDGGQQRHRRAPSRGEGAGHGPGDEVITTPFSFVASANCVLFVNAVPVFADIDPVSFNVDPALIERRITSRTEAILPVHVFGRPADMDAMLDIAQRYNLRVIEDSCEALGARWRGRHVGTLGDAGAFAFYPNKQMTTGEGGMIVTNDPASIGCSRACGIRGAASPAPGCSTSGWASTTGCRTSTVRSGCRNSARSRDSRAPASGGRGIPPAPRGHRGLELPIYESAAPK